MSKSTQIETIETTDMLCLKNQIKLYLANQAVFQGTLKAEYNVWIYFRFQRSIKAVIVDPKIDCS